MNIVSITGTPVQGCTYHMKERFLAPLRKGNQITEFVLPRDLPHFCCGCKRCFFESETCCPHAAYTLPLWDAIKRADLLVFASPVYALRTSGQMKTLLDHLCCHWMVHRPDKAMFQKRAVILTNSIGAPNSAAQKDIATSLRWMGISSIRRVGIGLMEGVIWDELSEKRRQQIEQRIDRLSRRYARFTPARTGLRVRLYFEMSRLMHKRVLKQESTPSTDNQHWIDQGWITPPNS